MPEIINYEVTFIHRVRVTANNEIDALRVAERAMEANNSTTLEVQDGHRANPRSTGTVARADKPKSVDARVSRVR